jgi:VanZ family protein
LRGSRLARVLLAAYLLLAIYASLFPFSGWRDPGMIAALRLPWPRFVTGFDVWANFFGYLPYGLLCVLAFAPAARPGAAALAAVVSAALLSGGLEVLQGFLPARIPSSLDVVMNVAGAAVGAGIGLRLAPWLEGGPIQRARRALLTPGPDTDLGFALLGLWLFAQLHPAALAFGTGDLRDLFAAPAGAAHRAEFFVAIEAMTCAANLLAVALLASALIRPGSAVRKLIVALVGAGLAVKALAFAILMQAEHLFAWLTPGAWVGVAGGTVLALAAVALGRTARLALAAVLLMAATVLINLSPPNPYLAETLRVWSQGHFLNFNGLTRLVSAGWPFAALAYLIYLASMRSRETAGR